MTNEMMLLGALVEKSLRFPRRVGRREQPSTIAGQFRFERVTVYRAAMLINGSEVAEVLGIGEGTVKTHLRRRRVGQAWPCRPRDSDRDPVGPHRAGQCSKLSVVPAARRRDDQLWFRHLRAMYGETRQLLLPQPHVPTVSRGATVASLDARAPRMT
jgi:hypothetical protein